MQHVAGAGWHLSRASRRVFLLVPGRVPASLHPGRASPATFKAWAMTMDMPAETLMRRVCCLWSFRPLRFSLEPQSRSLRQSAPGSLRLIVPKRGQPPGSPGCPLSLPAIPDEHRMRTHRFDHPAVRVEVRGLDEVRRRIEPALQVCPVSRLLQRGPEQKVEYADEL